MARQQQKESIGSSIRDPSAAKRDPSAAKGIHRQRRDPSAAKGSIGSEGIHRQRRDPSAAKGSISSEWIHQQRMDPSAAGRDPSAAAKWIHRQRGDPSAARDHRQQGIIGSKGSSAARDHRQQGIIGSKVSMANSVQASLFVSGAAYGVAYTLLGMLVFNIWRNCSLIPGSNLLVNSLKFSALFRILASSSGLFSSSCLSCVSTLINSAFIIDSASSSLSSLKATSKIVSKRTTFISLFHFHFQLLLYFLKTRMFVSSSTSRFEATIIAELESDRTLRVMFLIVSDVHVMATGRV